jgi:hypothetical protein
MENKKSFRQENLESENVKVVAILNDLSGNKYFLQSESGKYIWLDSSLDDYKEVDENTVASAVVKHGYKPVEDSESFIFSDRKNHLT